MALFGKVRRLVGLDIGSSSVKLVELKRLGKGGMGYQLVNLGLEELPPETIVDGAIMDSGVVIDSINRLFSENRIKLKDVATSISGSSVIIRKIVMPAMSDEELAESIPWEAEQYIPFDIGEVSIDYQVVERTSSMEGENMSVILVAVKKDKINEYTAVISQAGKNPVVVDVDAFALENAYEINYPEDKDKVVALINIGASVTNVTILQRGTPEFWRDISMGGNQYTEAIQRELGLSFDQAENLKKGFEIEGVPAERVIPVINSVSANMVKEVQKTLDFFQVTSLDKIVISGGASKTIGLDQILSERFSTPVEIMNPFRALEYNPKDFDAEYLNEIAPNFAIAVGLGLRELGDKE